MEINPIPIIKVALIMKNNIIFDYNFLIKPGFVQINSLDKFLTDMITISLFIHIIFLSQWLSLSLLYDNNNNDNDNNDNNDNNYNNNNNNDNDNNDNNNDCGRVTMCPFLFS